MKRLPPKQRSSFTGIVSDGFTMVEMLIVLVVLAVLLTIAVPGFIEMIRNNAMMSESYAMRATLNHARSESLARRAPVVVCPSTDGVNCNDTDDWSPGYMTFVDTNDDNAPDADDVNEAVIQWETRESDVDITFSNDENRIRFDSLGAAIGFEGIFTFCDDRGATRAIGLILVPGGSVTAALDADDDGIVNVDARGGGNVSC